MAFFSLFVIGAVILGAGAMLSPAWPSKEPRIGMSATFILGIIAGGAVWWAELFGWDTLIIDYLLFGIVSLVILGGTLSRGGGENSEAGWPSRGDLVFLVLAALICMMPLFVLRLPLGEAAASDALITLAVRESGSFTSLSPFYPEVTGFAPPAFHALAAYLSQQLRQPIPTIHMAIGSLIAFLCVWTVYDLGAEIRDKRLGRAMAVALMVSFGVLSLLWQSYYAQLMGVLFTFAFITYALRYYRQHKVADMVAAGLMLGVILFTNTLLFGLLVLAYYLSLFVLFFASKRKNAPISINQRRELEIFRMTTRGHPYNSFQGYTSARLGLGLGILFVCFLATAPWLLKNWPALILNVNDSIVLVCVYSVWASIFGGYVLAWLYERQA